MYTVSKSVMIVKGQRSHWKTNHLLRHRLLRIPVSMTTLRKRERYCLCTGIPYSIDTNMRCIDMPVCQFPHKPQIVR